MEDAWNSADPEPDTAMLHLFADGAGAALGMADAMETTGGEATPAESPVAERGPEA